MYLCMMLMHNAAQKTTTKRPMYENPGDLHLKRTTEYYTEKPKKPIMNYEYESSTKKTTTRLERYAIVCFPFDYFRFLMF